MSQVVLPITAGTNQTFTSTLPVNGGNVTLTFTFTWNAQGGYWWATITDAGGDLLLDGVPVTTGRYPAANILRQYQYLGIGSAYLVPNSATLPDNPDFTDLGTSTTAGSQTFSLIWSDSSLT
ncbi:MAG: phage baseplate plug family protein [Candidatus Saccharimonadales bacterium]